MEAEKRPSLESSTNEEGDRLAAQDHLEEEEDSAKRSYGCTFCKRGFTNAQALGGHMNIHRKDRVKGKGHLHHQHQVPVPSSNDVKKALPDADNSSINPDPVGGEGTHPMIPCAIISQVKRGFIHQNKCCQILAANPIRPRHKLHFMESDLMVRIPKSLGRTDRGLLDDDLSLRIGPSASPDCKEAKISQKKTEIDLELRLGRDP